MQGKPEKFSVSGFELIDDPASGSAHAVRYVLSDGVIPCTGNCCIPFLLCR